MSGARSSTRMLAEPHPDSLDGRLPEYSAEALSNLHIIDLQLLAQRVVAELARRAKA